MRRGITAVLLLVLSAGCATSTRTSNAARIQSLYDSFARGDAAAVLAAFDPDIVWREAEGYRYADRNPYRGPQAIAEGVFGRLMSEWSDFRVTPQRIIDGGDVVVALGRYSGASRATGKPIDAQFAHVWTLRDGRIVGFEQYTDTAQFTRALMP
ncbi:MAG TPA: nuclear transport factor 2 family protein [Thermoanaerobaculia bacterium]